MPYNVVFITSDQHRRDAVGCYGNPIVKTPNLDKLAAQGVRFTNAYCDSPLCAPSRASYMTGRLVHKHTALTHRMDDRASGYVRSPGIVSSETLGTMFRKAGHTTAAIGKLHVHGETRKDDLGFDVRAHRFYTYDYEDYVNAVGEERVKAYLSDKDKDDELKYNTAFAPVKLEQEYMQDSLTTESSVEFIGEQRGKPFFIHVGMEKPHPPWTTQKKYLDIYDPSAIPIPANHREWWENPPKFPFPKGRGFNKHREQPYTEEKMQKAIASYYACISELDDNIGRVVDALEQAGVLGNTVIIFSADHGDNLFEHGLEQKHCFYEGPVGVPLIITVPDGFPAGAVSDQLTALVDVMPTLAELNGLPIPGDADGKSLVPALRGEVDDECAVFSEFYEWREWPGRMIRYKQWKLIHYHNNVELLFDLEQDPGEMNNLVDAPETAEIRDELRERLLDGWSVPGMV